MTIDGYIYWLNIHDKYKNRNEIDISFYCMGAHFPWINQNLKLDRIIEGIEDATLRLEHENEQRHLNDLINLMVGRSFLW